MNSKGSSLRSECQLNKPCLCLLTIEEIKKNKKYGQRL